MRPLKIGKFGNFEYGNEYFGGKLNANFVGTYGDAVDSAYGSDYGGRQYPVYAGGFGNEQFGNVYYGW